MDNSVQSFRATWDKYTTVLNAASREEKGLALAECAIADVAYTDPMMSIRGADALVGYMLSLFEMNPGGTFETTSFLAHHGRSLAKWDVKNASGVRVGEGSSYAEYDESGRISSVAVFFVT